MVDDRDYWRGWSNARLIEEAKYNPSVELCVVLAERLDAEAHPVDIEWEQ